MFALLASYAIRILTALIFVNWADDQRKAVNPIARNERIGQYGRRKSRECNQVSEGAGMLGPARLLACVL
ncbi:MAG TPA: hypothetical protein PLE48_16980 [Thiobacillus sp.]|nr:hypothetical protein [Thiobacillus sp.]